VERSQEAEIMDHPDCPEELLEAGYRDLMRIHRWLGDLRAMARAVAANPRPVRRVLDVGCGRGGVMRALEQRLGVETVGVDVRPWPGVLALDATRDPLPEADVAISVHVAHHLSEEDLVRLIQNVRRASPRFILMDLVRSRLPLTLFRLFVAPLVCDVVRHDGAVSVRRAFTPEEMKMIVARAVGGAPFRQRVAPLCIRQVIEI
jgi:2-polyprenyl-3-methyl-5-hydroxy-6-metoxy-1,4-benzoquinol methylase